MSVQIIEFLAILLNHKVLNSTQKWINADESDLSQFKESDCSALTSVQIIEFLAILLNHKVCTILNTEMDLC